MDWLTILGTAACAAWLYLLFGRGQFWRVQRLNTVSLPASAVSGPIAAIIPARNEADVIGRAVSSLLQQCCADVLHIFVVDDNSSDGTAEAARQAAARLSRSNALTVIAGEPLPFGWTGKVWAMQQGIEQALLRKPRFLLLTDADIAHSPDNVAVLVALAESEGYDLTSFMVKLHCRSVADKLLIPAFVFFFFMLYPPAWIPKPHRRTAGAAGGCMLLRPAALERAGGLAAIRSQIIDDCALAAMVKRSGGKVWLGITRDTLSLRTYPSFGEIEHMIARNAFNQLRHSAWLLAGAILGVVLVYQLPVALLLSGRTLPTVLGASAWLLMFAAYLPMARFYGLNPFWALTLPLTAAFYAAATLHSAWKYWSGKGGEWKGRAQDRAAG